MTPGIGIGIGLGIGSVFLLFFLCGGFPTPPNEKMRKTKPIPRQRPMLMPGVISDCVQMHVRMGPNTSKNFEKLPKASNNSQIFATISQTIRETCAKKTYFNLLYENLPTANLSAAHVLEPPQKIHRNTAVTKTGDCPFEKQKKHLFWWVGCVCTMSYPHTRATPMKKTETCVTMYACTLPTKD